MFSKIWNSADDSILLQTGNLDDPVQWVALRGQTFLCAQPLEVDAE